MVNVLGQHRRRRCCICLVRGMLRPRRGLASNPAKATPVGVGQRRRTRSRCHRSSVAGCTNRPRQTERGSSRQSPASTAVRSRPLSTRFAYGLEPSQSAGDTWRGRVAPPAEEVDMVAVGDRVVVESEKVGTLTRSGVVMAVEGRLITVRWDSGVQSVFIPAPDRCESPATSRQLGRSTASKPAEAQNRGRDARGRLPRTRPKHWEEVPDPRSSTTATRSCVSPRRPSAAPICTSSKATSRRRRRDGSSATRPWPRSPRPDRAYERSSRAITCCSSSRPAAAAVSAGSAGTGFASVAAGGSSATRLTGSRPNSPGSLRRRLHLPGP